jgi:hypothetical protein
MVRWWMNLWCQGALNLISNNYPDHGHRGRFSYSRKNAHGRAGNRTRDLMVSSQTVWPLDHKAGLFSDISSCIQRPTFIWKEYEICVCKFMSSGMLKLFEVQEWSPIPSEAAHCLHPESFLLTENFHLSMKSAYSFKIHKPHPQEYVVTSQKIVI